MKHHSAIKRYQFEGNIVWELRQEEVGALYINNVKRQRHSQIRLALTRPSLPLPTVLGTFFSSALTTNPDLWAGVSPLGGTLRGMLSPACSVLCSSPGWTPVLVHPSPYLGLLMAVSSLWLSLPCSVPTGQKPLIRAWLASALLPTPGFPEPRELLALMVFCL